ncbi:MAG: MarR family winged helix-turn-helix transcriptional regulator [Nocardioidaceae bacterium]
MTDLTLFQLHEEGVSGSAGAALVSLCTEPRLSGTELGRRVGLTQSAAVRMIDGLVSAGLVQREPHQGRSVAISLTESGRQTARQLLSARHSPLAELLDGLTRDEQENLDALLEKILARAYANVRSSDRICRLCDRKACTTRAVCPVGAAERADPDG